MVLEWPERILRIVAEVQIREILSVEEARETWLPESRLKGVAFYVYVPTGYAAEANRIIRLAQIKRKSVGLRTWRRIVGLRLLDITAVK